MRPPQPLPDGAYEQLTRLLQEVRSKADYRRVLCVWLRAALGLPAAEVALVLGWRTSSVYNLQSRYQQEGEGTLLGRGRTPSCLAQPRAGARFTPFVHAHR
jgi:transposase